MPKFPFLGAAYRARSSFFDRETCVNLYPETHNAPSSQDQEQMALYGTPGLKRFALLPKGGPVRCLHTVTKRDRTFAVGNKVLYELAQDGSMIERGGITSSYGPVRAADNGIEMILVDGQSGYLYTLATDTLAQIVTPAFYGADTVQFLDGYFVLNRPGTDQFYISDLYAGGVYNGAQFATAEMSPDPLVGVLVDHREVWLFGTHTTEVWFNVGGGSFPFARVQGAVMEQGCLAAGSLAKMDNSVFWLGNNLDGQAIIWRANGYQPQRISTHAIEFSLSQQGDLAGVTSYTYQQDGHSFYMLNCRNTSWCYDAATGLWHERRYQKRDGTLLRHRADNHTVAFNKHLVGDFEDGRIYEMSQAYYLDDTDPLLRERTAPSIEQDQMWLLHSRLELLMDLGGGLDGGIEPGRTPQMLLDYSDDSGATWVNNPEWTTSGKIGDRNVRLLWRRLGRSRERYYRFRTSDPNFVAIVGALLDVAPGGK
jgi:hypothetical protein